MPDSIAVLESPDYEEARRRLAADPIVQAMVVGLRGESRDRLVHEDGTPRFEFMLASNAEYTKRAGRSAGAHIGAVAEALLLLLKTLA